MLFSDADPYFRRDLLSLSTLVWIFFNGACLLIDLEFMHYDYISMKNSNNISLDYFLGLGRSIKKMGRPFLNLRHWACFECYHEWVFAFT